MKITIEKNETNLITVRGLINGKKVPFLIDTGASASVIDGSWVDKLNLQRSKKIQKTGGGIGTSNAQVNLIEKLEIDIEGRIIETEKAGCMDLSHVNDSLEKHGAEPIAGVIGADILMKYKGVIDYDKMILRLTV